MPSALAQSSPEGSSTDLVFETEPLGTGTSWLLGRGSQSVAILVPSEQSQKVGTPLVLQNLQSFPHASCIIREHGTEPRSGSFTVVRCTSNDAELRDRFVALARLLPSFGCSTIREAIDVLVELFEAAQQPPKAGELGLWGELAVITGSDDPIGLLEAWHGEPSEALDFVTNQEALEIKTTRGEVRRHRFALTQLRPPGGRRVWVVSILAVPSASGDTVPDLVNRIVPRLAGRGELQLKLERQAAKWIGNAWGPTVQTCYDLEASLASARVFLADDVPAIALPIPIAISRVEFEVDLTGVRPSEPDGLAQLIALGT